MADLLRLDRAPALERCSVAVLRGGASSEREVSLVSGEELLRALAASAPPGGAPGPREVRDVQIDARGRWLVDGEALDPCAALLRLEDVELFALALHGGAGEDGTLQGLLESAGRRYTGSGVRASALCMDKRALRELARGAGLAVAAGECIDAARWRDARAQSLAAARALSAEGWVVKPRCGGSSVATFVLQDAGELEARIAEVLATGDDALVEARVAGVEVSCGVLGNRGEPARALTPIEIQPAAGRFFDYQQKYASAGAREVCPPPSLAPAEIERVRELAARAHRVAGCDGYSRADLIVPRPAGEPVLLEVNTLPGFTPRSLLPQMAAHDGIDYRALCLLVLTKALERPWGAP